MLAKWCLFEGHRSYFASLNTGMHFQDELGRNLSSSMKTTKIYGKTLAALSAIEEAIGIIEGHPVKLLKADVTPQEPRDEDIDHLIVRGGFVRKELRSFVGVVPKAFEASIHMVSELGGNIGDSDDYTYFVSCPYGVFRVTIGKLKKNNSVSEKKDYWFEPRNLGSELVLRKNC